MITSSALIEEFQFMGIEGLDDNTLVKCIEIASKEKINAERLVEEWIAFAQTNLKGNLQPSLVSLDMMVRKQFTKNKDNYLDEEHEISNPKINVYRSSAPTDTKQLLMVYSGNSKNEGNILKSVEDENVPAFSPASFNPSVSQLSTVYAERKDAGEVTTTFGRQHLNQDKSEKKPGQPHVNVNVLGDPKLWATSAGRYMFESPEDEANAMNSRIERLGHLLQSQCQLPEPVDGNPVSSIAPTYGRVRCEGDGRLNAFSVLLETSRQHDNGQVSIVNLKNVPRYSLFPGQIIAFVASIQNSLRRNMLTPSKLYYNAMPVLPAELPNIREESGPLKVLVACGPFTLADNLAYQPLQDLVRYVVKNRPHVLILVGPFVDRRHSCISDGTMAETFDSHFETIMEHVTTPLQNTDVQVVVVPSYLDAHHHSVYPTPPFEPLAKELPSGRENVHMVSDPAMLDINGLIVGVTSADVLFHLAKTEFNVHPENQDRMARLASHILAQRSFYPIYPPQASGPGNFMPIDQQSLATHGKIDVTPHVLILPSNLQQFVKNVNGCIVINPERLSKGFVGGTFVCMDLYPGQKTPSVADNISCRIIKI